MSVSQIFQNEYSPEIRRKENHYYLVSATDIIKYWQTANASGVDNNFINFEFVDTLK